LNYSVGSGSLSVTLRAENGLFLVELGIFVGFNKLEMSAIYLFLSLLS